MLRNSDAKVSISAVSTRTWRAKRLYITTAGMAAARPTAVATSASAIPGATAWMLELVVTERPRNAVMIPHTVPKRPMNGAVLAVVARKVRPRSRRVTSCLRARTMARCTVSMPPNSAASSSPPGVPRYAHVEHRVLVRGKRRGRLGEDAADERPPELHIIGNHQRRSHQQPRSARAPNLAEGPRAVNSRARFALTSPPEHGIENRPHTPRAARMPARGPVPGGSTRGDPRRHQWLRPHRAERAPCLPRRARARVRRRERHQIGRAHV